MFAPIGFTSPVYQQAGLELSPLVRLDTNRLFAHLWIGPRYGNYYFGNYYGGHHRGFTPWCNWNYGHRHYYDPIWSWANVHYRRQGVDYIGRVKGWHNHYERNEHDRPGRTWDEQRRQIADRRPDDRVRGQNVLANDLRDVVRNEDSPIRFTRLDDNERERVRGVSDDIRKLHTERSRLEREVKVARVEGNVEGRGRTDVGPAECGPRPDADRPAQRPARA